MPIGLLKMDAISMKTIMTSQLPTIRPVFIDGPTKSTSKGDVPRSYCIGKEIPKVNILIPNP